MSDDYPGTSGAIWVAFGPDFLMMAIHSARTFKENNPGRETAVITNIEISECTVEEESVFDHIIGVAAENKQAFMWKLFIDRHTPFEKAVFLDADTEIRRNLDPVFRVLGKYPFAICPRETPCNKKGYLWEDINLSESGLREFNSGVFAYDLSDARVHDFFNRLRNIFDQRDETVDQPSFMLAVYEDPAFPVAPLSVEWNATNRRNEARAFIEKFPERVGVYHYREPLRHLDVARGFMSTANEVILRPRLQSFEEAREKYSWPMKSFLHFFWYHWLRISRKI